MTRGAIADVALLARLAIPNAIPGTGWAVKFVPWAFVYVAIARLRYNGSSRAEVALRTIIDIDETRPCALTVAAIGALDWVAGACRAEVARRARDLVPGARLFEANVAFWASHAVFVRVRCLEHADKTNRLFCAVQGVIPIIQVLKKILSVAAFPVGRVEQLVFELAQAGDLEFFLAAQLV